MQESATQRGSHSGRPIVAEAHYAGHAWCAIARRSGPADRSSERWCNCHELAGHATGTHTAAAVACSRSSRPAGGTHITESISSTKRSRCGNHGCQSEQLWQIACHISTDSPAQCQVSSKKCIYTELSSSNLYLLQVCTLHHTRQRCHS